MYIKTAVSLLEGKKPEYLVPLYSESQTSAGVLSRKALYTSSTATLSLLVSRRLKDVKANAGNDVY